MVSREQVNPDCATLTVDVTAIVKNWRMLAAKAPGAETAVALKANAYGLGMLPIAQELAKAKARTFFVATLEEGIELRTLRPDTTIYVLNGLARGGSLRFLAHQLRPCLNTRDEVLAWSTFGHRPAALHIDTGMNRLGLGPDEVSALAADRQNPLKNIDLALVMSHLACAEEPDNPMNARQLRDFHTAVGKLGLAGKPLSIANSSGIFLGPEYHLQMTRPGAAVYGLNPLQNHPNPMRQVLSLEGKILQTRRVDTRMSVGYGATHLVGTPGRLATVGIGYADGFMRRLSNRGSAFIAGRRVPIVGRVSMDLITLDVSALPDDMAKPGSTVELLGANQSPDDLAADAGTIGYEILTSLGRRYRRVYEVQAEAKP